MRGLKNHIKEQFNVIFSILNTHRSSMRALDARLDLLKQRIDYLENYNDDHDTTTAESP